VPAITSRKALLTANIKRDFISILLKAKASSPNASLGKLAKAANAPRSWIVTVRETVELDIADEGRGFRQSLPPRLKLIMR
jgi:hypothetical protein